MPTKLIGGFLIQPPMPLPDRSSERSCLTQRPQADSLCPKEYRLLCVLLTLSTNSRTVGVGIPRSLPLYILYTQRKGSLLVSQVGQRLFLLYCALRFICWSAFMRGCRRNHFRRLKAPSHQFTGGTSADIKLKIIRF